MAGLLGDIFSAGNVAKRKLTDLLNNPVLSAQQFVGNINDKARNLNEMTAAAAREGAAYGPASQQLAGLLAEGYNPMGITVYHGSPYKFNKFDSSKIGSGEGTAAYGHGLYVAEAPETARAYQAMAGNPSARRQQKNRPEEVTLDALIMLNAKQFAEGDVNKLADVIKRKPGAFSQPEKLLSRIEQYQDNRPPSFMYEANLPDEQIAKMINWENPVPEEVRKKLSPVAMEKFGTGVTDTSGELLYKELTKQFKSSGSATPEADASEFLRSQGIPGMSHLDAGSRTRTRGEGTQNFVVFPGNEDLLTIMKRNGGLLEPQPKNLETTVTDASEIFGQGAKRIQYTDPNSGGLINVLQRPDGTASVLGLEVPEAMRGQGIGQALQSQVMQDFPEMMGQVSSKAAAKTAHRLGRRPPNQPEATLEDVYKIMDEYSSVNLVSPDMQKKFMQSLLD